MLRLSRHLDGGFEWLSFAAVRLGPSRYFRVRVELTRHVILCLEHNFSLLLTSVGDMFCFLCALLGLGLLSLLLLHRGDIENLVAAGAPCFSLSPLLITR